MVAKKKPVQETPAWGGAAEAQVTPDDADIPAFLKGETDGQQMDIEDVIGAPEQPRADGGAGIVTEHTNIATPPEPEQKAKQATPIPGVDLPGGNANRALIGFVERIERVNEEIAALQDDRKEIFAEMKAEGFNVSIVREVLRRRKMDPDAREEHDSLLELYEESLR